MRFKNRYFLLEIKTNVTLNEAFLEQSEFTNILKEVVTEMFGSIGFAKVFSSLRMIYYNPQANYILVRCARDYFRILKQAFFYLIEIKGVPARINLIFVSGTIKACETKLILYLKANQHSNIKQLISLKDIDLFSN